jgi:hypothetical protein
VCYTHHKRHRHSPLSTAAPSSRAQASCAPHTRAATVLQAPLIALKLVKGVALVRKVAQNSDIERNRAQRCAAAHSGFNRLNRPRAMSTAMDEGERSITFVSPLIGDWRGQRTPMRPLFMTEQN